MRESERVNARQHPRLWRWGCGTAGVSTAHPTRLKLANSCCCIACALQTLQKCPVCLSPCTSWCTRVLSRADQAAVLLVAAISFPFRSAPWN